MVTKLLDHLPLLHAAAMRVQEEEQQQQLLHVGLRRERVDESF